jgi:zeaxanthin epoxidase
VNCSCTERLKVIATLTTGETHEGDVLIGADGINSKMCAQMRGEDPNNPPLAYAGYAVYTAICDYSAPHRDAIHTDVDKTGYQVFLGPKQYFVRCVLYTGSHTTAFAW